MKLKNAKDIIEKVFNGKYDKVVIHDSDVNSCIPSNELTVMELKSYKTEKLKKVEREKDEFYLYF